MEASFSSVFKESFENMFEGRRSNAAGKERGFDDGCLSSGNSSEHFDSNGTPDTVCIQKSTSVRYGEGEKNEGHVLSLLLLLTSIPCRPLVRSASGSDVVRLQQSRNEADVTAGSSDVVR